MRKERKKKLVLSLKETHLDEAQALKFFCTVFYWPH